MHPIEPSLYTQTGYYKTGRNLERYLPFLNSRVIAYTDAGSKDKSVQKHVIIIISNITVAIASRLI